MDAHGGHFQIAHSKMPLGLNVFVFISYITLWQNTKSVCLY